MGRARIVVGVAVVACLLVAALVLLRTREPEAVEALAPPPTDTSAAPGTIRRSPSTEVAGSVPGTAVDAGTVPSTAATAPPTTPPPTAAPTTVAVQAITPPPTPAPTVAPAPTRPPPPTTAAPPPIPPTMPPPSAPRSVDAFRGLGAWVDVLDWSQDFDGTADLQPADVDTMAAHGVQTLYLQTSRFNRDEDVLEPAVLRAWIDRAHANGMKVVGWYLPTHEDEARDLRRLLAAAQLPVDAIGVDIESTAQTDVAERNRQLVDLSAQLRASTAKPMGAIVIPPVVTNILNTKYWPNFPWKAVANVYDVFLPMGYWTNRTVDSGWRDAHTYTAKNIDLVRQLTGRAVPIHAVGGIADETTPDDVAGLVAAVDERGALGGSLYDAKTTTNPDLWPPLQALRR